MHFVYKLIALSVVFGVVLAVPASRGDLEAYFDDDSTEMMDVAETAQHGNTDKSRTGRTVDIELAAPVLAELFPIPGTVEFLPTLIKLLPIILAIKTKLLPIAVKLIKCLAPKVIFLAIGAVATFAFCKTTNLCSVAYTPAVYDYVPSQVRDMVTPQSLEDAQRLLNAALQQYAGSE